MQAGVEKVCFAHDSHTSAAETSSSITWRIFMNIMFWDAKSTIIAPWLPIPCLPTKIVISMTEKKLKSSMKPKRNADTPQWNFGSKKGCRKLVDFFFLKSIMTILRYEKYNYRISTANSFFTHKNGLDHYWKKAKI